MHAAYFRGMYICGTYTEVLIRWMGIHAGQPPLIFVEGL
jgi:hypothetical protein